MGIIGNYFSKYSEIFVDFLFTAGPKIVAVILVFLALNFILKYLLKVLEMFVSNKMFKQIMEETEEELEKRVRTMLNILRKSAYTILWSAALLVILSQLGINIGPILATAGVLGLAISFGAQSLVKDLINGLFIIIENQIRIGDVAVINGTGGLVETINLRTVTLRDLAGVVHIFPNGSINSISNMTYGWSAYVFDIGVAYKEDVDHVSKVMVTVLEDMRQDEKYKNLILEEMELFGVDDFADSAVVIKARVKTKPNKQWEVAREYRRRLKKAFDEEGIEIPFPHRSIYFGEVSQAFKVLLEQAKGRDAKGEL